MTSLVIGCTGAPAASTSPAASTAPSAPQAPEDAPTTSTTAAVTIHDYSLELAAHLADARSTSALGPQAVSRVVSEAFLLVASRRGWPFDDSVDLASRALPAMLHNRFGTLPQHAVTVFLFQSAAPYDAFCKRRYGSRCQSEYGKYDPERGEIVVNVATGGRATATHELSHVLMAAEFDSAPEWFDEGVATLFEIPKLEGDREITSGPNQRHEVLIGELAHRTVATPITLDHLFAVSHDELRGPHGWLAYAMAHDFCAWLDQRGQLWPLYAFWRDHADRDATGRWSFEHLVGRPAELTEEWLRWVQSH